MNYPRGRRVRFSRRVDRPLADDVDLDELAAEFESEANGFDDALEEA